MRNNYLQNERKCCVLFGSCPCYKHMCMLAQNQAAHFAEPLAPSKYHWKYQKSYNVSSKLLD